MSSSHAPLITPCWLRKWFVWLRPSGGLKERYTLINLYFAFSPLSHHGWIVNNIFFSKITRLYFYKLVSHILTTQLCRVCSICLCWPMWVWKIQRKIVHCQYFGNYANIFWWHTYAECAISAFTNHWGLENSKGNIHKC